MAGHSLASCPIVAAAAPQGTPPQEVSIAGHTVTCAGHAISAGGHVVSAAGHFVSTAGHADCLELAQYLLVLPTHNLSYAPRWPPRSLRCQGYKGLRA
jgi:hypothetical protein